MCESGQGAAADTIALPFLSVQPCCFLLGCPVAGLVDVSGSQSNIQLNGSSSEAGRKRYGVGWTYNPTECNLWAVCVEK